MSLIIHDNCIDEDFTQSSVGVSLIAHTHICLDGLQADAPSTCHEIPTDAKATATRSHWILTKYTSIFANGTFIAPNTHFHIILHLVLTSVAKWTCRGRLCSIRGQFAHDVSHFKKVKGKSSLTHTNSSCYHALQ